MNNVNLTNDANELEQDVKHQDNSTRARIEQEMPIIGLLEPIPLRDMNMAHAQLSDGPEDYQPEEQAPLPELSRLFFGEEGGPDPVQEGDSLKGIPVQAGSGGGEDAVRENEGIETYPSALSFEQEQEFPTESEDEGIDNDDEEGSFSDVPSPQALGEQPEQHNFTASVLPQADGLANQEPTDFDVKLGRGGESNKHPGNIDFRRQGELLKPMYWEAPTRRAKRKIAKKLVNWVKARPARFMEKREDGSWAQASDKKSIDKASQFLRTKREAKRAWV